MKPAVAATTEVDEFLADVLPRQEEEERALRNGDPGPRIRMWSSNEPLSLFGAEGPPVSGWERAVFGRGQVILRDHDGMLTGGSDPRADGCAMILL